MTCERCKLRASRCWRWPRCRSARRRPSRRNAGSCGSVRSASPSRRRESRSTPARKSSCASRATTPRMGSASSAWTRASSSRNAARVKSRSCCGSTSLGDTRFECNRMCGAGHNFMRGELVVRERTADRKGSVNRKTLVAACLVWVASLSGQLGGQRLLQPGDPACRAHAAGVRGVPARSRRFHRSRDRRGGARPGVQRHELRGLPQRAGHRRRRDHARDAGRVHERRRIVPGSQRSRRHARFTCSRCRLTAASR